MPSVMLGRHLLRAIPTDDTVSQAPTKCTQASLANAFLKFPVIFDIASFA